MLPDLLKVRNHRGRGEELGPELLPRGQEHWPWWERDDVLDLRASDGVLVLWVAATASGPRVLGVLRRAGIFRLLPGEARPREPGEFLLSRSKPASKEGGGGGNNYVTAFAAR